MRIRSFRAWRPAHALAAGVASVPYDVVSSREAAELAQGNPNSFLHVSRSEIDLPPGINPYAPEVYRQARAAFDDFRNRGVLLKEQQPSLYLYRQKMGSREQTGLVACCETEDYMQGLIKKHELTRADKEDDRTRHIAALDAQSGPVFLIYRDMPELAGLLSRFSVSAPLYDFVASDGIAHTVWRISEPESVIAAFQAVPALYIADGHHRAAGAARIARERRAANSKHTGKEEYNAFLAVLFPASQLRIMPYNRLVRDLNGRTPQKFSDEIKLIFKCAESAPPSPVVRRNVSMFLDGRWRGLAWEAAPKADPVAELDVSVLQNRLLGPVLGIDDPRTSKRIDFVGGIRGADELEARVASGEHAVAFSMYPTSLEQLMAIADAGGIMPPKSTWFEPKLRSGLLIHSLDA